MLHTCYEHGFSILHLASGLKELVAGYGANIADTQQLVEVYNNFISGDIDKKGPIADVYINHVRVLVLI